MRFLLLTLVTAACGFSALAEDDYFPLHIGDESTMAATLISKDGKVFEGIVRRSIETSVNRDGETWFRLRMRAERLPIKMNYTTLVRKDRKAFYCIYEGLESLKVTWKTDQPLGGMTPNQEQVVFGLPLVKGAVFKHKAGDNTMTCSVLDLETVTLAGETYTNCYHLRRAGADGYQEDDWQAANIGPVKMTTVEASGKKFTYTLKEFKPGK